MQGVEHEAHHLTMRTNRHLKTIRSTHTRTLLYYCGIYTSIVLASVVQARADQDLKQISEAAVTGMHRQLLVWCLNLSR